MKLQNRLTNLLASIRSYSQLFWEWMHDWTKFFLLLFLVIVRALLRRILIIQVIPLRIRVFGLGRLLNPIESFLENSSDKEYSISKIVLIEMAIKNMRFKKTRTLITVGGMSLGIGAIVFLVSLGFGVQRLVIQRVARLDEMRQTDTLPQPGSKITLTDKEFSIIKSLPHVEKTLPIISMVGKVTFNNSVSDMPVYGVTSDYLASSAVKPITGKIFESNDLTIVTKKNISEEVAGAFIKREDVTYGDEAGFIKFDILPETWIEVRDSPDIESPIIGFIKNSDGHSEGTIVWGKKYSSYKTIYQSSNEQWEQWIRVDESLWERHTCDPVNKACDSSGTYKKIDESKQQVGKKYITLTHIKLLNIQSDPEVLGISDNPKTDIVDITKITASSSPSLELALLASESAGQSTQNIKKIAVKNNAIKKAVITRAMAKVLGLTEKTAIGKSFGVTFVQTNQGNKNNEKIESIQTNYEIIGVIPEATTAYFYVPFIDLRGLGVTTYSQFRVIAKEQHFLSDIRKKIESLGFNTSSVVDTVNQIETLFGTARIILASLGMVALFVAALGMFNTLTVSLMERTREIGLMRAIGMRSDEIRELFLVESMLMGFFGGLLGLIVGITAGKIAGIIISIFTVLKGAGYVDISDLPLSFVVAVLSFSIFVGLVTGIYPARRATKISALNALRYE